MGSISLPGIHRQTHLGSAHSRPRCAQVLQAPHALTLDSVALLRLLPWQSPITTVWWFLSVTDSAAGRRGFFRQTTLTATPLMRSPTVVSTLSRQVVLQAHRTRAILGEPTGLQITTCVTP